MPESKLLERLELTLSTSQRNAFLLLVGILVLCISHIAMVWSRVGEIKNDLENSQAVAAKKARQKATAAGPLGKPTLKPTRSGNDLGKKTGKNSASANQHSAEIGDQGPTRSAIDNYQKADKAKEAADAEVASLVEEIHKLADLEVLGTKIQVLVQFTPLLAIGLVFMLAILC